MVVDEGLSIVQTSLLALAACGVLLTYQFRASECQPFIYWPLTVLMSVVGTLVSDVGTDY